MVRDAALLEAFERDEARRERLTVEDKYRLLDALYAHARALGHFRPDTFMDGIEHDITLARTLHALVRTPSRPDGVGA
jgi:hypothetical protein